MRAERAVEPTRSENITVTWRRSAVSCGCGSGCRVPKPHWKARGSREAFSICLRARSRSRVFGASRQSAASRPPADLTPSVPDRQSSHASRPQEGCTGCGRCFSQPLPLRYARGGISSAVTNSFGMTLDREWSERVATLALIGKVTKHIDRLSLNAAPYCCRPRSRGANRQCPSSVPWLLSAAVFENG